MPVSAAVPGRVASPIGMAVGASPVASPIPIGGCDATPPTLPADRPRYVVDAAFDPGRGQIDGTVDITFTPDQPIERVVLRLWANGGVRDATAPVATFRSAVVTVGDGAPRAVTVQMDSPTVAAVAATAPAGRPVRVRGLFATVARGERNDRISVTRSTGRRFVAARFGSFLPVVAWEPGVGWNLTPPTRTGAESSMTSTADWDVTMSVVGDSSVGILASGEQVQPGHWVSTGQRDWAMTIGRFEQDPGSLVRSTVSMGPGRRTVAVTVGIGAPLTEPASAYLARAVRAIRLLSALYGDYPWPTYTLAITPGLKGGIEFPSHVMQGPGSTGRTTTHEVAHQWFYGLVGNDQGRDPWIDEGLATWAEARADGTLAAFAAKAIPPDGAGRAGRPMTYWDAHRSSYYRSVYVQTLQALNALDDTDGVDCALRRLIATSGNRVARPADVISALGSQFPNAETVLQKYGLSG